MLCPTWRLTACGLMAMTVLEIMPWRTSSDLWHQVHPVRQTLKELKVGKTGMGEQAGQALVQTLRDGAWPDLRYLDLGSYSDQPDERLRDDVLEVLEGGAGSKLEELIVSEKIMPHAMLVRLCIALRNGMIPCLRELDVCARPGR